MGLEDLIWIFYVQISCLKFYIVPVMYCAVLRIYKLHTSYLLYLPVDSLGAVMAGRWENMSWLTWRVQSRYLQGDLLSYQTEAILGRNIRETTNVAISNMKSVGGRQPEISLEFIFRLKWNEALAYTMLIWLFQIQSQARFWLTSPDWAHITDGHIWSLLCFSQI